MRWVYRYCVFTWPYFILVVFPHSSLFTMNMLQFPFSGALLALCLFTLVCFFFFSFLLYIYFILCSSLVFFLFLIFASSSVFLSIFFLFLVRCVWVNELLCFDAFHSRCLAKPWCKGKQKRPNCKNNLSFYTYTGTKAFYDSESMSERANTARERAE